MKKIKLKGNFGNKEIFLEIGKYKNTISFYNKSLKLNPTNFAIYLNKGICYEKILKIKIAISLSNNSKQSQLLLQNLQK